MKLFYYWLLLAFIFFAFCKKNAPNNAKSDTNYPDTLNIAPKTSILWSNLCSIKEFEIISDCKIKSRYNEYYEVKLTQDPFKPLILISIFFDKNNIAELYLTEIKLSPEHSKNHETKYSNLLQIELTSNPHAVYCYYNKPKKIEIQKTNTKSKIANLKKFFTQDH